MTRQETLAVLSAQNPEEKGFFFTSDNQAFTEKNLNLAENHAKTLSDNSIEWLNHSWEEELTEEVPAETTPKKGKKAKAAVESAPDESAPESAPEDEPAPESAPDESATQE